MGSMKKRIRRTKKRIYRRRFNKRVKGVVNRMADTKHKIFEIMYSPCPDEERDFAVSTDKTGYLDDTETQSVGRWYYNGDNTLSMLYVYPLRAYAQNIVKGVSDNERIGNEISNFHLKLMLHFPVFKFPGITTCVAIVRRKAGKG
jgi:hypothetical protein